MDGGEEERGERESVGETVQDGRRSDSDPTDRGTSDLRFGELVFLLPALNGLVCAVGAVTHNLSITHVPFL